MSDLHMELGSIKVRRLPCDVVVLAGDIHEHSKGVEWARKTFPDQPVIYVAGNHEFYRGHWDRTLDDMRSTAAGTNVHFLEDGEVVIDGVRFLGSTLWTDFKLLGEQSQDEAMAEAKLKLNDYRSIKAPGENGEEQALLPTQSSHRFERSAAFLRGKLSESFSGQTIVVTHHAPHPNSIRDEMRAPSRLVSAAYASDLSDCFETELAPVLAVHGHLHRSSDYTVGKTRVICNPRGYPGRYGRPTNPCFDEKLIIQIDNTTEP